MEIKDLEIRMYVLAGQLEEAKKIYKDAVLEIEKIERTERAKKEQPNTESKTIASGSDSTVSITESAEIPA